MTEKIIKALRELDVNNDNHWTDAGLPRIETVRMLAGNGSLSRDEVTAAFPGFTRQNPNLENVATSAQTAPQVPTPPPAPVTPAAAPAAHLPAAENAAAQAPAAAPTTQGTVSQQLMSGEEMDSLTQTAETEEKSELGLMQDRLSWLEGERNQISVEIDNLRSEIDKLLTQEAEKPTEDPMTAWRKSLQDDIENRIAFQNEFGTKLKALGNLPRLKAPIDSAMAAQNERKRREGTR